VKRNLQSLTHNAGSPDKDVKDKAAQVKWCSVSTVEHWWTWHSGQVMWKATECLPFPYCFLQESNL